MVIRLSSSVFCRLNGSVYFEQTVIMKKSFPMSEMISIGPNRLNVQYWFLVLWHCLFVVLLLAMQFEFSKFKMAVEILERFRRFFICF
jgi:hypothetical protein